MEAEVVNPDPLKFPINNGAVVRVMEEKQGIFYGFVFDVKGGRKDTVTIKAYDQLKYLMYNDTFVKKKMPASQAITEILKKYNCVIGSIAGTQVALPGIVEDDKKALDVITQYLDNTLTASNKIYVLFDNFGKVDLRLADNMRIRPEDFYIGENSLLYDYEYEASIDDDTYNQIKLVRDNEKKSKREVFIAKDSGTIAKWGMLQKFRKVDDSMKDAEVKKLAENLLQLHNREKKSIKLSAIGNWRVRAGRFMYFRIDKYGIKRYFLIDEVEHEWNEGVHTMDLKVSVF